MRTDTGQPADNICHSLQLKLQAFTAKAFHGTPPNTLAKADTIKVSPAPRNRCYPASSTRRVQLNWAIARGPEADRGNKNAACSFCRPLTKDTAKGRSTLRRKPHRNARSPRALLNPLAPMLISQEAPGGRRNAAHFAFSCLKHALACTQFECAVPLIQRNF